MDYHGYLVNAKYINSGRLEFKNTGNGAVIVGTKNGKEWRIKKNMNYKKPRKSDCASTVLYNSQLEKATYLEKKQKRLKDLMKTLSCDKDHIVVEEDHFWDTDDNLFVTVMRNLPSILPNDYAFDKESKDVKIELCRDMMVLIKKIHDVGVIHGDLKEPNFLYVKSGSKIIPYLTDFDSSYPADEIPLIENNQPIPYSNGYESPEIAIYEANEDNAYAKLITKATDIYTMGLIFHCIFVGYMPKTSIPDSSVALTYLKKGTVAIHNSLDVPLRGATPASLKSLVNWMITPNSKNRPTAEQVLDVIDGKLQVDPAYINGSDIVAYQNLWNEHLAYAKVDFAELKAKGIESFMQVRKDKTLLYEVKKGSDTTACTLSECIKNGYITSIDKPVDPFDGDDITMLSPAELHKMGVAWIEKNVVGIFKKYSIVYYPGVAMNKNALDASGLVKYGVATSGKGTAPSPSKPADPAKPASTPTPAPKPAVDPSAISICEPWDTDKIKFKSSSELAALKVSKIERSSTGKYYITKGAMSFIASAHQLVSLGVAVNDSESKPADPAPTPTPTVTPSDTGNIQEMWDEDKPKFEFTSKVEDKIQKLIRYEKDGKHYYGIVFKDGTKRVTDANNMVMLGYFKRK